jgi:methionyl aminopeptidase
MAIITIKTPEQIDLIFKAGAILSDCLSFLSLQVQPGVTGLDIDKLGDDFVQSFGATAACKGYDGFPNGMCISVNSGAVHCVPNNTPFQPGDVIKLDMVVDYKGWKADSAITVLVPPVKPEVRKLAENTYTAMRDGIRAALEGNTVQDISRAIYAARGDSGVILPFTGHGIGRDIHEAPGIPNYVSQEKNALLVAGIVLCIEPIFCLGDPAIYHQKGQWNTWMLSGEIATHFEHTILVNPTGQPPTILTLRKEEIGL